ncbi:MAG TPA: DNA-3-methyladenine glycosylase I [bacterium]|jgi:DNA-3-methyladenine glycosylase I|nr:DNA-3-methyladenine glycosylase I [bacterium]
MPNWPDLVLGADGRKRCGWCGEDPLYVAYHDQEWGVPVADERALFEFLTLEGAQAGLSWITVLRKREAYRKAFADFDPRRVARFDAAKAAELLKNPGIIRNRLKVAAAISNAAHFLEVQKEFGSFAAYAWSWVGGKSTRPGHLSFKTLPAASPRSDAWSADLRKRGFKFVGSMIMYAHMQATGMVNDHLKGCFRHKQIPPYRFKA